jgi:hypothetical protein
MKPKVKLLGKDGNAFAIMGNCHEAWKKAKLSEDEWVKIRTEMTSGDYDNLLSTAMKYFEVS